MRGYLCLKSFVECDVNKIYEYNTARLIVNYYDCNYINCSCNKCNKNKSITEETIHQYCSSNCDDCDSD